MESESSRPNKKAPIRKLDYYKKSDSFPIVAIGASAGGLEAITELLKNLPSNTGMAFIYVQHLSPDHKSMLAEILSHATSMKVQEINDMDTIQPNHVFVIPHDKGITAIDGHIKLIPRAVNSSAISIDILFSSLAKAQKERVIGIVLSGSGSDGTYGLQDIKHEGGLTFAQDDSAKFTSMPNAAIAAGVIDFILSPKEIAVELTRLSTHPFIKSIGEKVDTEDLIENDNPYLKIILQHLLKTVQVDFSSYKMNTIKRRIMRRMLLHKLKTLKEYSTFLLEKNEETEMLHQDLLINVSSFFRDIDTHKYLKTTLFPKLLKSKKEDEPIRIWIPACSTGEEVFSIGMLLLEILRSSSSNKLIQIFATDLSKQAIAKARLGIYSKAELEGVSAKRQQNFFTKSNSGYQVNKELREICSFASHNILTDPPFSRLDFISCCNLFIYLDTAAQKSALATFHYALNDGGFLMLGKSETISSSPQLFTAVNKMFKIFLRKKNIGLRGLPVLSTNYTRNNHQEENTTNAKRITDFLSNKKQQNKSRNLDTIIDDVLVAEFMPASVAINHHMDIVQFRGSTELYLKHPKGKATYNILKMVLPEIAFELRNAISQAIKTKDRVKKSGVEVKTADGIKSISIEAFPLENISDEALFLIVFTEQNHLEIVELDVNEKGGKSTSLAKDRRIKKLEEEIAAAHNAALGTSQEQEAFIEELQSANEEVVSSNEELQTVNEELQTSKEEIESANEELITTNQELHVRNIQLNESYDYSEAVSDTIYEPMVVLDKNQRVKSANKSFYKEFKLLEEETVGELLFDLGNKQWNIPRLRELLENIVPKNSHFNDFEITHNFQTLGEKIMLLNARRVFQKSNSEHLVLVVIRDITEERKKTLELKNKEKQEAALKAKWEAFEIAQTNMNNVFLRAPAMICILRGPTHVYEMMNDSYKQLIGFRNIIGKPVRKAFPELAETGIYELLDGVFNSGKPFIANEMSLQLYRYEKLDDIIVNFVYQPSYDANGQIDGIIVYASEVTEQVLARKKIEESEATLKAQRRLYEAVTTSTPDLIYVLDLNYHFTYANEALLKMWGTTQEKSVGKSFLELGYEPWHATMHEREIDQVIATKKPIRGEVSFPHATQGKRIYDYIFVPVLNNDGNVEAIAGTTRDITELKQAEETLKESEKQFTTLANTIQNLAWMANPDGSIYWYNQRWYDYTGTTPQEMEGWGWQSVHDFEYLPTVLEKWQQSINTGESFEMVFPLKGADGIFRPFLTLVHPVRDDDGHVIRWIGTNTDISKQKEAEEQFRQMAERMPQKIWTSDIDGNRNYFNQKMLDYCGLSFDELQGRGWEKIIHPEDWSKTKRKFENALITGEDYENEYRLLNKNGKYLWHIVRATAIKDEQGKIKMWIGSKTEIHDQIELSETLDKNLKESNKRMQTILQDAPDAIIAIDENGIIKSWNTESETIFGWKDSEAIGKTLSETIVLEGYCKDNEEGMKQFLKTNEGAVKNKPIELSAIKKDGTAILVEVKISLSHNNEHDMCIVFLRDISVRKEAEETIKNKTNQLIEAQQLAHIGSWEWDVRTNKIEWSDELYRIYDLTPHQFKATYEHFLTYVHPDDKVYVNEIVENAFKDHQPFKFFQKALCGNGKVRILSSTGKVFTDETGNVIKMSGTTQDVTEQKRYEEELKISEERFYKIFDSNPVPMTLSEIKTNKIKYANTLFYNAFGYTAEEVIGHSSEELKLIDSEEYTSAIDLIFGNFQENRSLEEIQALSKEDTEALLLKLKQSENTQDLEILFTKKNGEKFPVVVSFEIIKMGTESYTVISDITARKKAEEQLRSQNEQLEKMNKELESFVYVSSHDLQEPLRKIQIFASQISEKESTYMSDGTQHKILRIQNAAFRMQTLIQDLLAYSRTNTQQRKFEIVDLRTIIEEVKDDLKEELLQKNATIVIGQMCDIKIIMFQFRQLLFNLVSNSLKFSKDKVPPIIKINCETAKGATFDNDKLSKEMNYCHISVTDNGIGFEQEYSEKIFLVFQRLHGKEEYQGTGIGLAIVKKIVENHNGIIEAKGQLNKGATFNIYIPVD